MAFGAGSEVAHQAVRGVMGGSGHQEAQAQPQANAQAYAPKCQLESNNLVDCLKYNANSINNCQAYMDLLKECEGKK